MNCIGAGLADGADRHRRPAERADAGGGIFISEPHIADIAERDARQTAGGEVLSAAQQDGANAIRRFQLGIGAHDIAALSFGDVAGGDRGIGAPQRGHHIGHGEAVARHLFRIHGHAQFALRAAIHVNPGDARHALEAFLDDIFDKITIFVHRANIALLALNDEPGDGRVLGAGGTNRRLVGFLWIAVDAVETVGHEQQRPIHIVADIEFQRDLRAVVLRLADHAGQAFQALQDLLLAVGHFALDLGRRCAHPVCGDGEHRLAHVGRQLNGDCLKCDEAEQENHQYRRDDGDRPRNGKADEIHLRRAGDGDILARPQPLIAADNRKFTRCDPADHLKAPAHGDAGLNRANVRFAVRRYIDECLPLARDQRIFVDRDDLSGRPGRHLQDHGLVDGEGPVRHFNIGRKPHLAGARQRVFLGHNHTHDGLIQRIVIKRDRYHHSGFEGRDTVCRYIGLDF